MRGVYLVVCLTVAEDISVLVAVIAAQLIGVVGVVCVVLLK